MTEERTVAPYLDDEPPADVEIDLNLVRRYQALRASQKIGEAEAKAYKEEADAIEAQLVDMFADAGLQNLNVDGQTVFLHRSVFAQRCEGIDIEDVKAALRAAGHGDLVTETVNGNTLNAFIRELTEDDDAPGLPDELEGVLQPGERFSVRINASRTRAKRPRA